jgi:hypothetical protein
LSLVAACGSTAQVSTGAIGPSGAPLTDDGLGGSTGGPASTPGLGGTSGGTTGGSGTSGGLGGASSGTTGLTPGFGTSGGSTTGGGSSGNAPGITAKEVYVGFVVDKNAGAVNSAVGVGSITSGDSRANTEAVVKDINKHGGIGGRKLVPVWGTFDETSSQTFDQQYAAICEHFTRDKPRVFAVNYTAGTASYRSCLTKAGVLMVSNALPELGDVELRRFPTLIEQGYPNLDRLARYLVTSLQQQKYFTPWDAIQAGPSTVNPVKVGILTYDDVVFSRVVDKVLVPALKAIGYDPVVQKIGQVDNAGGYGQQAVAVKSAQLAFSTNRVTHVIPFESNGGLSTLFLPVARSQGYYPRFGVSSSAGSEALMESGIVQARQFNGAVGFGWLPALDLPTRLNPDNGPYSNANQRYCLKVMKENGITFDSTNAKAIALNICSSVFLLKAALGKTTGPVSLGSALSLIEGLGTSYQRAGTLGQQFVPGRRDPTNKAYAWKFFNDCECFHYTGTLQTVP